MAMLADSVEVVIGVDTHKQTHTAAVLAAATGQALASLTGLAPVKRWTSHSIALQKAARE